MSRPLQACTEILSRQTEPAPADEVSETIDRVVNSVDRTRDWSNGMGCTEHMRTRAALHIVYSCSENPDGSMTATPVEAFIEGSDKVWTEAKLVGFYATSVVTLEPAEFRTEQHTRGVDGQWTPSPVGGYRTDSWRQAVPLTIALADQAARGGAMKIEFPADAPV